ncbi:YfzA family protein (plasmid) [Bacillus mycoides]|uniref:YfzA family protein n=1 Tax=Bacillus mycoides TaxID=1405 RepID=UPI0024AD4EAF|nr:YfzA family protein [Bacillus mycoides]MDI6535053.1 YfzA family protein [Bacillus mycoides]WJE61433.1 YfzA family protein [Bacillus mycoides]WJE67385.1 YfzA family protein [Bacillus mycoides]WJE73673.1 YfzA family protein [Bacillus mycoides]
MAGTKKTHNINLARRWIITVGIFLIVQFIFIAVDGTSLEPKMNDSGDLIPRIGSWVLELKLFNEWITPYSYPFFNMLMTIHVIAILILAVHDIISIKLLKK